MPPHPTHTSAYIGRFFSALASKSLERVDLETLEHLEKSPELEPYLDPSAPKVWFVLVQTHIKRRPGSTIFSDQYGLTCVKILIRMVQVLACAFTGALGVLRETMDIESTSDNVVRLLANHITSQISGRPEPPQSVEVLTMLLEKSRGLFNYEMLNFLIDIIWCDRKQFFILFKAGSFPGVSLLFCILWEQMKGLGIVGDPTLLAHLRDLLLRCYLVTPSDDRRTAMRLVCIQMYMECDLHQEESRPYDTADTLGIVQAYRQSLTFIVLDPDHEIRSQLDVYRYLLELTSDLTTIRSTHTELPLIAQTAIERLWIAFEREKVEFVVPPSHEGSQVKYYMSDLAYALGELLDRTTKFRQPPKLFLEALAQSDWSNILARFLLLVFRPPVFLKFPADSLKSLPALCAGVVKLRPTSHDVFVDAYSDWLKVLAHLRLLFGSRLQGDRTITHVLEAIETWIKWGASVGFAGLEPDRNGQVQVSLEVELFNVDCTNPRCAGGLSFCICRGCGEARYCSKKCQNDDWVSSYPDSHRGRCEAKNDRSLRM